MGLKSCRLLLPALLCLVAAQPAFAQVDAEPEVKTRSELILPETTQGALIVSDASECWVAFSETDIGKLYADPDVTAFIDSLRERLRENAARSGIRFGINVDEILSVVTGEISIALVRPADKPMALCMLADVGEDPDSARGLLSEARDRLAALATEKELEGGKLKEEFDVKGVKVSGMILPREKGDLPIVVYSAIADDWMVFSDDKDVITDLIGKLLKGDKLKGPSLATDDVYKKIMEHCDQKYGDAYFKWFIKPFGFAEAIQTRTKLEVGKKDYVAGLKKHGYDAVQGAGGKVGLNVGEFQVLSQNFVYAPPVDAGNRFKGAARALDFANNGVVDMAPDAWVPANASTHFALFWDVGSAFKHSIPMIEDVIFGRKDTVTKALEGLRDDEQGPKVDVMNDLLAQLGRKITVATHVKMPIDVNSERLLMTVKIDGDEKRFGDALGRMMKLDAETGGIEMVDYKGHTLWVVNTRQIREKNADDQGGDQGESPGIPGQDDEIDIIPGFEDCGSDIPGNDDDDEEDGRPEKGERLLKEPLVETQVFVVANRHLVVTNNVDYTKELLDMIAAAPEVTLSDQEQFKRVNAALDKLSPGADSLRRFVRLDESYRMTYELLRAGKLPESKSILGAILNSTMQKEDAKARKPEIDGSLLPEDFDMAIAPYLGCFGWCAKTEADGWMITGAMLSNLKEDQ